MPATRFVSQSLSATEQKGWLIQHIPHRVCAALALLGTQGHWKLPPEPKLSGVHGWCVGRSVEEGRMTAIRWLIEFVGIKHSRLPKTVTIQSFGVNHFDDPNQVLQKIWKACSQACSHPTSDSGHDPLGGEQLTKAFLIVAAYLETSLYIPRKLDFRRIVWEQDDLLNRKTSIDDVRLKE